MIGVAAKLRRKGVLGMNERNVDVIQRFNPRHLYPLVDDKLATKRLALDHGIAVPELYGAIHSQHDVRQLARIVENQNDFVVKPAQGAGGDGIVVVAGHKPGNDGLYQLVDGNVISQSAIFYHVANILSGQYSLAGTRDCAMIEYRVKTDPFFDAITFQGVPDIRVIALRGYPIMAMARLPTRKSRGKANLHQGAVGVGIDIATGMTNGGVIGNDVVAEHPDTSNSIRGLVIPGWEHVLELAARCFELTQLGYLGVDIVLDETQGPLILELNARPGLNIQIANGIGLNMRIEQTENWPSADSAAQKVARARAAFKSAH